MRASSHKFSIAPSGETTDRIKTLGGAKIARTSSITMRSMVWVALRHKILSESLKGPAGVHIDF